MSDIGKWCRRLYVDRPYDSQQTVWHLIQSEIEDSVITKCGRRMERVAHWGYRRMYGKLGNHLEIDSLSSLSSYIYHSGRICKRCA